MQVANLVRKFVDKGAGRRRLDGLKRKAKNTFKDVRKSGRRRKLPQEGIVSIAYSPNRDGDPDPGEVVWAWVPYEEDPSQGKDRPVVIIGRRGDNLVGIPLTTKQNDREAQVVVGTGEWDHKRRTSHARIWRMLELDEGDIRREGAILPRDRFDDVIAAVDEYYDIKPAA